MTQAAQKKTLPKLSRDEFNKLVIPLFHLILEKTPSCDYEIPDLIENLYSIYNEKFDHEIFGFQGSQEGYILAILFHFIYHEKEIKEAINFFIHNYSGNSNWVPEIKNSLLEIPNNTNHVIEKESFISPGKQLWIGIRWIFTLILLPIFAYTGVNLALPPDSKKAIFRQSSTPPQITDIDINRKSLIKSIRFNYEFQYPEYGSRSGKERSKLNKAEDKPASDENKEIPKPTLKKSKRPNRPKLDLDFKRRSKPLLQSNNVIDSPVFRPYDFQEDQPIKKVENNENIGPEVSSEPNQPFISLNINNSDFASIYQGLFRNILSPAEGKASFNFRGTITSFRYEFKNNSVFVERDFAESLNRREATESEIISLFRLVASDLEKQQGTR